MAPAGRATLVARLEASLARLANKPGVVVVLALGLDRLSQINETWGYETGDRLLVEAEERLVASAPAGALITRTGGDQFVVVCETPESEDVEAELAERVLGAISGQYTVVSHALYVTASLGVAGCADADEDGESLVSAAETARAEARRLGGRRWERADQAMRVRVGEQLRTEQALDQALRDGELTAHYQPIIDLATGATSALESLARWYSPTLGAVSTAHFIARAEETGLIVPMGHWMIDQVVRDWSGRCKNGSKTRPAVGVNVSGIQFRLDADDLVRHLLEASRALEGQLWVEITESMLFEEPERALEILTNLKAAGIGLVIDDFGTGYSSLSQLRRLPVDAIKIDRTFIGRIHEIDRDRAIVDAMIRLAHALGIVAIAEGVESLKQVAVLREMSCDEVQGFLYSPAVPFEMARQRLRAGSWQPRKPQLA